MRHFHFKTLNELDLCAKAAGASHIEFEPDAGRVKAILAREVRVGGFTIGNSIAIHPMEGCDGTPDGRPGELTWRRYGSFASGGAKLIWFEATAVRADGRANSRQLRLHPETMPDFARLLEMLRRVHQERRGTAGDLLEVLQLTHAGRYSVPSRLIACHNPALDKKTGISPDHPVIPDDELEQLEDDYVEAARLAADAGFRAIDIAAAQGHLLNELLSAKLREGRYGGSLENRARFIRNVTGKIRAVMGERLMLCIRLGCFDGLPYAGQPVTNIGAPVEHPLPYPYGFGVNPLNPLQEDLTEVKQLVGWLGDWGIKLVSISMGSPHANPHIERPYEEPDAGGYEQPEHPLLGVDRHFRIAGELQRAFPGLPMVGGGYSWLQRYMVNAAARNIEDGNIAIFGVGRTACAYPGFARDALAKGELDESRVCKTDSLCAYLTRRKHHPHGQFPAGCVSHDTKVYGPIMEEALAPRRKA